VRRRLTGPPARSRRVGVYFIIPLVAALRFTGFSSFPQVVHQEGFSAAFELSVKLAVITTVLTIVLMLPTTVYVHLRLPRLRRLMEGVTILPIVIPPVVLIVGMLQVAPGFLKSTPYLLGLIYVVLAMPFAYRAFDAGLRALDLSTLVEAAQSLGAGWRSTLWRVMLPNLRTASVREPFGRKPVPGTSAAIPAQRARARQARSSSGPPARPLTQIRPKLRTLAPREPGSRSRWVTAWPCRRASSACIKPSTPPPTTTTDIRAASPARAPSQTARGDAGLNTRRPATQRRKTSPDGP
jgi:Binding-protein-dependent transport system inner membrane component